MNKNLHFLHNHTGGQMMKRKIAFIIVMLYMILPGEILQAYEFGDVMIHGFISQGYLYSDKNDYLADTSDGTFQFNEMGINFSPILILW